jgi:hypothetical protein
LRLFHLEHPRLFFVDLAQPLGAIMPIAGSAHMRDKLPRTAAVRSASKNRSILYLSGEGSPA